MTEAERLPEGFARMKITEAESSASEQVEDRPGEEGVQMGSAAAGSAGPEGADRYSAEEQAQLAGWILAGKILHGPSGVKGSRLRPWLASATKAEVRDRIMAWRQEHSVPSLERCVELAGYGEVPRAGSVFVTRAGEGGEPGCVEWTERPGYVDLESLLLPIRLGPLPEGTVIVAKEVAVVTVPADRRRGKAPGPGISVRRASAYLPGKDCWVNVTKWGTKYAYLQEGYTAARVSL